MNINLTLVIELVSFLLLLFVLGKWFYKPLLEVLDKRGEKIASEIKASEEKNQQAEQVILQAKAELEQGRKQALSLLEKARQQADEDKQKIIVQAKEQSAQFVHTAQRELAHETNKARQEILKQIKEFVVALSEKVISKNLDAKDAAKIIDRGIKEIEHGE